MSMRDNILATTERLWPKGRAFRFKGYTRALQTGLAMTEVQLYQDSVSILDSLMPDTDRFTVDDCSNWERILGLASNAGNTLDERKAAILRKMSNPGIHPAKGHLNYVQHQLQLAGFNVFVYENLVPLYPSGYSTMNPAVLNAAILSQKQYGGGSEYGGQYNSYINNVVVNSIDNSVDVNFDPGGDLRNTFFIGGNPLGTYANVPASRMVEFRQTILQLKQAHLVAYLFINYV